MQHGGVPELFHLIIVEFHARVRSPVDPIHDLGQPAGQGGDAPAMSAGGRIPALNRRHAGRDEALEKAIDLLVQVGVLDRDPHLVPEAHEVLQILLYKETSVLFVDGLQDTEELVLGFHRDADHVAGHEPAPQVGAAIEAGMMLHVVDDLRLTGLRHMSGDPLPHFQTNLSYPLALLPRRDLEVQLPGRFIQEQQRTRLGVHHHRGGLDGPLSDLGLVQSGVEEGADLLELSKPSDLFLGLANQSGIVESGHGGGFGTRLPRLGGKVGSRNSEATATCSAICSPWCRHRTP